MSSTHCLAERDSRLLSASAGKKRFYHRKYVGEKVGTSAHRFTCGRAHGLGCWLSVHFGAVNWCCIRITGGFGRRHRSLLCLRHLRRAPKGFRRRESTFGAIVGGQTARIKLTRSHLRLHFGTHLLFHFAAARFEFVAICFKPFSTSPVFKVPSIDAHNHLVAPFSFWGCARWAAEFVFIFLTHLFSHATPILVRRGFLVFLPLPRAFVIQKTLA